MNELRFRLTSYLNKRIIQSMKLLTVENAKTIKGEALGYLTGILYLAPANESGCMNTCPMASAGCKASCLYTAGRASFTPSILIARKRKTLALHNDRPAFMAQLRKDVAALVRKAKREGLKPAVRVNGTSDLAWMALELATEFSEVQFYDYTKLPRPWLRASDNYHLTFSLSESNTNDAAAALAHGMNVAVAFHVKRGRPLPATFMGAPVIDGDAHDLRFLDGYKGAVIGLRAKGQAKKDVSGFVQISTGALQTVSACA